MVYVTKEEYFKTEGFDKCCAENLDKTTLQMNWILCPTPKFSGCKDAEYHSVGIVTETGNIVGTCVGCNLEVNLTP